MDMRAAILHEQGLSRPYVISQPLQVELIGLDGPRDGEVLVEIRAAGLCHSDLSTIEGIRPRPIPLVPGHEASGIIREVGPGVEGLRVDDHVVMVFVTSCGQCPECVGGRSNLCGSSVTAKAKGELIAGGRRFNKKGGILNHASGISCFAEYAVVDQRSAFKISDDIPLDDAAVFGCAVITGVGAVLNTAAVKPGQSVAIIGLGGVGLNAVMASKIAEAGICIAIDVHDDKLTLARDLGATHVIDARADNIIEIIKDLTAGGLDHAFDMAGNVEVLKLAYSILRNGGVLTSAGLAPAKAEFSLKPYDLVSREIRVQGSYMGSCTPSRDLPKYLDYYRCGRLPVNRLITGSIGLEEINKGFDDLADGVAIRQILRPSA
ncbi:MAG: alcohol dehydrogenase [Rhodospirillaceae bacterium TMED8]|nr:alcohol dehydrogenase [Magnetovibrio sp.]OUT50733.1 MAG: alcohol dehydrogenase [Rhodospirillaceae bacterium TMED8]